MIFAKSAQPANCSSAIRVASRSKIQKRPLAAASATNLRRSPGVPEGKSRLQLFAAVDLQRIEGRESEAGSHEFESRRIESGPRDRTGSWTARIRANRIRREKEERARSAIAD